MKLQRVDVTGIGCISAAGRNLNECMKTMFEEKRNPTLPTRFKGLETSEYPVFEIPDHFLEKTPYDDDNALATCRLAMIAFLEAMTDAGLSFEEFRGKQVGVCIGSNVASAMSSIPIYCGQGSDRQIVISPQQRFLLSDPSNYLASRFHFNGPCQTIVNACSSGTDAMGIAASWIRSGRCDIVVCGGSDECYQITYNGFISLMICDKNPCRPFDRNRNGLNLGEGAAMFILESDAHRRARKAIPKGQVAGYGTAADADHFTSPRFDGLGLKIAVKSALDAAGLQPEDISFINAHGTGTRGNDEVEAGLFHDWFNGIPFISTKGYVGHTLGASGAIEAAFTLASLNMGYIPASIGFSEPDPELNVVPVNRQTPVHGTYALSQTLAFGGNNSVIILKAGGSRG